MSRRYLILTGMFLILFSIVASASAASGSAEELDNADRPTIKQSEDTPTPLPDPALKESSAPFRIVKITGAKSIAGLKAELNDEELTTVLKMNRVNLRSLRKGMSIIVPNAVGDASQYSPFPLQIGRLASLSKVVLVSQRVQAFGAYEDGTLVRWGPISSGALETPTPNGLYHANWKSKLRVSSVDPTWLLPWCVNLSEISGISFHKYDLPGRPGSHGCIRLLEEDALWMYEWADLWIRSRRGLVAHGTPVMVFGEYSYGQPGPWNSLIEDAAAATVGSAEIAATLDEYLPTAQVRVEARHTHLNRKAAAGDAAN